MPGLAKLLSDEDADVRETARRALENNPSPDAGAALRAAMDKATDAKWKVALTQRPVVPARWPAAWPR